MKKLIILFVIPFYTLALTAQIKLPQFFGDNMVLQRDRAIPVWGWAGSKEKITVQLNKQSKTITADKAGKWQIDLDAEPAGGPYSLTVKGKNTINISNVLLGDVWICSGQSNMEMKIGDWGFINNYKEEIAAANYPAIRQFEVKKSVASIPQTDVTGGEWKLCTPENAADFSATAYFFARKLQQELNVPIGLINTSWGGTHVETWTSREAFENSNEFKLMIDGLKELNIEELQKKRRENLLSKILQKQGVLTFGSAVIANWKNMYFDDVDWDSLHVPGLWEQQGLEDLNGVVWFRKTFFIGAEAAGKDALLELAMIDDTDETYLNGEKIGSSDLFNTKRKYSVPKGILKVGKNVIAIRVNDTGGGGGIYGEATNVKLIIGNKEQNLAGSWHYRVEAVAEASLSINPNSYPTLLFNAMISPLIPYAIKGAIWYQGESNAGRAHQYRTAFPLMITDWRNRWQQGDFPFYFVQLASYNADNGNSQKGSAWAELREAQAMTLSLPNTGMAVTTDIGDAKDIHPKNKQDVGKRLADIALNKTYNKGNVFTGPTFSSFTIEANKIIISFTNKGSGLMVKDPYGYIKGFEIAGADQKFYYAKAMVEGDHVVVFQDGVDKPVAVRFGWADDAGENNLFNREGFPAAPFRTDNWKGVTERVKYIIGD